MLVMKLFDMCEDSYLIIFFHLDISLLGRVRPVMVSGRILDHLMAGRYSLLCGPRVLREHLRLACPCERK